jgi:hypothetical protein
MPFGALGARWGEGVNLRPYSLHQAMNETASDSQDESHKWWEKDPKLRPVRHVDFWGNSTTFYLDPEKWPQYFTEMAKRTQVTAGNFTEPKE